MLILCRGTLFRRRAYFGSSPSAFRGVVIRGDGWNPPTTSPHDAPGAMEYVAEIGWDDLVLRGILRQRDRTVRRLVGWVSRGPKCHSDASRRTSVSPSSGRETSRDFHRRDFPSGPAEILRERRGWGREKKSKLRVDTMIKPKLARSRSEAAYEDG